jgi:hypothetical protein
LDVLIGECTGRLANEALALGWGRMWIARDRNIYTAPGEPWGLDNGAFRDWKDGKPFDGDLYRRVLDKAVAQPEPPMLAVIPDAPGNRDDTLRMADAWLPELPPFPWYMAVQDGMTPRDVEGYPLAGIFLGGTDKYKASAPMWRTWTDARGLPFHYGRCGTAGKIEHAIELGADSLDSALPMWTRQRWDWFVATITNGPAQLAFALARPHDSAVPSHTRSTSDE